MLKHCCYVIQGLFLTYCVLNDPYLNMMVINLVPYYTNEKKPHKILICMDCGIDFGATSI